MTELRIRSISASAALGGAGWGRRRGASRREVVMARIMVMGAPSQPALSVGFQPESVTAPVVRSCGSASSSGSAPTRPVASGGA
jgi:hypothetical protein